MPKIAAIPSTCFAVLFTATLAWANDDAKLQFSRDIRPILSDKCFKCHGPDPKARKAKIRFDVRKSVAHVLADGEDNELIARITSTDADERMPPAKSKLSLSKEEIAALRRWVKEGAEYEKHWSFRSIAKPTVPAVKKTQWPANDIDHFILARLESEGLAPSKTAPRERLIRRVTFDLTGLPPTTDQIDAFLADTSDKAYEKLLNRLLESDAFGERMTADWLDIARYSDSYGYQVDRDRHVWPWRDWVLQAFNRNMPFDQFITWQLAGDLLPNATDEQVLATTFCRLHPQKVEGGSTEEEFRVEYVADRNHTFATAFLGLTLECSRCHDHKYDPISQKEYYQLFAFFNSIDESGLYSYFTKSVPTPTLLLTNDAQQKQIADMDRRIADAEAALATVAKDRNNEFEAWLARRPSGAAIPGLVKHLDFENHKGGANKSVASRRGKAIQLSGDDAHGVGVGNFPRFDPFSVSLWMNTPDVKDRAVVFHRSRAWTDSGSRGYQLLIENGRLSWSLIHFWPGNAISIRTTEPIPTGKWLHVVVTNDGSSRAAGLSISINGRPAATELVRDNLYKNITGSGGDNITIGQRFRDRGFTNGLVDEFKVYHRRLAAIEIAQLFDGKSLGDALAAPIGPLTPHRKSALREYYLLTVDAEYKKQLATLKSVRQQRSKTVDGITEIMVMREMPQPRPTFLLQRGMYNAPADRVHPETPSALPAFGKDLPRNRLGLAKWLTDAQNPLAARVTVNHYWQLCFGEGLVRTPEDFGSQGEPPTHPLLLDWLAHDFVAHGWDLKRLMKQLLTSRTYRQSSLASESLRARDPENRLLARGPRYRLPAEMLRDNALATSGLLVQQLGGAPVRPYEVTQSFKPVGRHKGAALYRRSMYTYWRRTAPAPVMMSLDASKRDVCRVKRERTSSPLQAFVFLNDPQFVEAARMLGQRMLKKHGDDVDAMLADTFRELTSRVPLAKEMAILKRLHAEQLDHFERNAGEAEKFLATGDAPRDKSIPAARLAAAGMVASTLLNYDECVTKR